MDEEALLGQQIVDQCPDWWADVLQLLLLLVQGDAVPPQDRAAASRGWPSYFAARCLPLPLAPTFPSLAVQRVFLSEGLSRSLTTYCALQRLGVLSACPSDAPLRLHVLGCDVEAEYALPFFAELAGWLAEYCVDLLLCGPQCPSSEAFTFRNLTITMRTGLYHDLVTPSTLALPVCAIAFNMGYGVDWEPTVRFLVQHRIPTVVTGLDAAEVEFAQRAIEQDVGVLAVRFSGRNPFGSLRTLPAPVPPPVD
eukprot:EG_transcript_26379